MTNSPNITFNNDVTIPQLGFGVWQVDDDTAETAVAEALRVGYRHIDTAALYRNEAGVGRAVKSSGLARDEVFITTKLGNDDHGHDNALRAFDESLEKLGTDYVDLYLIHWPQPIRNQYVETWQALEKIYADGRAKAIGVSNFTIEFLTRLANETEITPVINQVETHPYLTQTRLRSYLSDHNIVHESWSPLGQGGELLADPALVAIAEAHNCTVAQVVLRWHLQRGSVVIPKSVTPSRIAENFAVLDLAISDDDMAAIDALDKGSRIGPNPEDVA